jgi:hypothetical protein
MMELELGDAAPRPMRYRFGLRWLLLVVFMFSIAFAWFARANHRVKRQAELIDGLAQIDVRVSASEPTGFALLARKVLGQRDVGLSERMDESWFSRPSELVTWTATDDQIPKLVECIGQLSSVRELHVEQSPLSDQGIAALRNELPGVAVLTRTDLKTRGAGQPTEHFATSAVRLLALTVVSLGCLAFVLAWPLIRWGRKSRG